MHTLATERYLSVVAPHPWCQVLADCLLSGDCHTVGGRHFDREDIGRLIDDLQGSEEAQPVTTSEDDHRSVGGSSEDSHASSSFNCWGATLTGDASRCDHSFVSQSRRFADKFCPNCRRHGCWFHSRLRALPDGAEHEQILIDSNVSTKGCWSQTAAGEAFRIVNCTARCTGPKLIIFQRPVPQWALDLTEPVFHENRPQICLRPRHGTLVPDRTVLHAPVSEESYVCWGGALSLDSSSCDRNHAPTSRKFNAKFCTRCRSNGFWLSGRARRLRPGTTAEPFGTTQLKSIMKGCWQFYLRGVRFRVVNNTFVLFDQPVPQWALAVTEPIFSDDRRDIHVHVKNGSLHLSDGAAFAPSPIQGDIPCPTVHVAPASDTAHWQHMLLSVKAAAGAIERMTPPVLAMPRSCHQGAEREPAVLSTTVHQLPALPGMHIPLKMDAGNPAIFHPSYFSNMKRSFAELAFPLCYDSMPHEKRANVFTLAPLLWRGDGGSSLLASSESDLLLPPFESELCIQMPSLPPSAPQSPAQEMSHSDPFQLVPPAILVPTTVPSMHALTLVFLDSTIETKYRVSRAVLIRDMMNLGTRAIAHPGLFTSYTTAFAVAICLGFLWHQEASGVRPLCSPTLQATMVIALAGPLTTLLFGFYVQKLSLADSQLPDFFSRFATYSMIFVMVLVPCCQPVMATPDPPGSFRDAGFMILFCIQCHALGFTPTSKLIVCTVPALIHIIKPVWGIGAAEEGRLMVSASLLGVAIGYVTEWRIRSRFLRSLFTPPLAKDRPYMSVHKGTWSPPTQLGCFVTTCILVPIAIFPQALGIHV